ncbi:hypothetical protein GW17_00020602 [Ensete ventricosum]|nr:hypothetical protein GW17_00020602 [Ensete ventricosum]
MGKGTDLWDDSALIDAFDHAMATYKVRFSSFSSFYLRLLGCSFSLPCIVGLLRCSFVENVNLVEEEEAAEAVATCEGREAEVRVVVGTVGGGAGEDEVGDGGDEDAQEVEEGSGDHCMLSIGLIDAHSLGVGSEALEFVISMGKVACV